GRLFISYPMIESIQYTKELPDNDFHQYTVDREKSIGDILKKDARQFCHYKGYSFLKHAENWRHIIKQHVIKANKLTTGSLSWPVSKDDVEQKPVFEAQLSKHVVPHANVAILNAFPLFLFYYFPADKFIPTETDNSEPK
ncbi:MAG: hypothetical protein K2M57_05645, partial [Paramuribaculum sp.]|nr:hypothetical protein [Paramuribaculum sp.]